MQPPAPPPPPPRTWTDFLRWTYIGVDPKFPGNGGPDCSNFTGNNQRIIETIIFATCGFLEAYYTFIHLTLPSKIHHQRDKDWVLGRVLLLALCCVFGTEIGFKLASGQLIYTLNPCHLVTIIQIYLLTAPADKFTMALFRVHMHWINGAMLAILFPVVNTRVLLCETESYYVQHLLIYIIPYFLMRRGGVFTVEPMHDFQWTIFSCGFLFFYHFVILHPISWMTEVNLNNMLCPAISDPFYGHYYRWYAFIHQHVLIWVHGKLYMLIVSLLLPKHHPNRLRSSLHNSHANFDEIPILSYLPADKINGTPGIEVNGHAKH